MAVCLRPLSRLGLSEDNQAADPRASNVEMRINEAIDLKSYCLQLLLAPESWVSFIKTQNRNGTNCFFGKAAQDLGLIGYRECESLL
jgi:hypothetical protein